MRYLLPLLLFLCLPASARYCCNSYLNPDAGEVFAFWDGTAVVDEVKADTPTSVKIRMSQLPNIYIYDENRQLIYREADRFQVKVVNADTGKRVAAWHPPTGYQLDRDNYVTVTLPASDKPVRYKVLIRAVALRGVCHGDYSGCEVAQFLKAEQRIKFTLRPNGKLWRVRYPAAKG